MGVFHKSPGQIWRNIYEHAKLAIRITSVESEYIIQIDNTTTPNVIYYGWAVPGSATSDAKWKVFRETISGGDSAFLFADSNVNFDKVWDDRASLSYG